MSKPSAAAYAANADKYLGVPYGQLDCQAFMEQLLAEVRVYRNWAGSNAMARDMEWIGTIPECIERYGCVPVGAWLFIWEPNGAPAKYTDGKGNFSHVGVKTGTGLGAVHSSKSKGQVCQSKFQDKEIKGGWNRVGICKLLDYSGISDPAYTVDAAPAELPVVKAEYGTVWAPANGRVNLRKAPGKHAALVDRINSGEPVRILEDKGTWLKVNWKDKRTGWMMTEFIERD